MAEQSDIEKLQLSIESLKTEIKCLAIPYEDALSHRVFDNTKKKLLIYLGSWVTIITAVFAFLGFNAYDKIVEKATDLASNHFSKEVMPKLTEKADAFIKTELKNLVNEKMKIVYLDLEAKVDSGISQSIKTSLSQSDIKLTEALKQIGNKLGDHKFEENTKKQIDSAVQEEQTLTADGWSFYGVLKDGKWSRKAFDIIGDDNNSPPSKQNKIKALTAVNIRKAAPTYTENEGYSYPGVKGVINEGEIIVVQDVKSDPTPKGEYFWVQVAHEHL